MSGRGRVLLCGLFDPGSLAGSFARAFERLGFQVEAFDYDVEYFRQPLARWTLTRRAARRLLWNRLNARTLELARAVRPDLVLAVKAPYLDGETVLGLRRSLDVPVVNYYPDNPYCGVPWDPRKTSALRDDLVEVLRAYSHVWVWGEGMAARLRADGVDASRLPFAVDVDMYRTHSAERAAPCAECGGAHEVVFVGQHNRKREAHVAAVREHAISLWGARWSRLPKEVAGRHPVHRARMWGPDSSRLYASAAVSLNILDDLNMPGHNMRTFEVPASGGVMLAHYTEEQAEVFPEGEAAVYYRDPAELDAKLAGLLADPAERARIAANAVRIAAEHTYEHRARTMLDWCDRVAGRGSWPVTAAVSAAVRAAGS